MCGIAGCVRTVDGQLEERLKDSSLRFQKRRGPDHFGKFYNEDIAFFHNRLSILDLSEGSNQPFVTEKGKIFVFNGEIYNWKQLASINFSDVDINSDTKILSLLLDKFPLKKVLSLLEGMYAIACYNPDDRSITLVRDRFGEKPLYYTTKENFVFASNVRPIAKSLCLETYDVDSILDIYNYGVIQSSKSIYQDINQLQAGHYLRYAIDTRCVTIERYFSPNVGWHKENANFDDAKIELRSVLEDSVRRMLIADRPVGAFLSGGYDSSLVVAIMKKFSDAPVKTFTIANQGEYDESIHAKKVARFLGTDHKELNITGFDWVGLLDEVFVNQDQPFGDSSMIPTFLVSQIASSEVTVSLTGDGADELFGGYNRYAGARIIENVYKLPHSLRQTLNSSNFKSISRFLRLINTDLFNTTLIDDKIKKFTESISYEDKETYVSKILKNQNVSNSNDRNYLYFKEKSLMRNLQLNDISDYLPNDILYKVDRMSMLHSLETRAPYLDINVFRLAQSLDDSLLLNKSQRKILLKSLTHDYIPMELMNRPKMGFSIDINNLLKTDLKEYAGDTINSESIIYNTVDKIELLKLWDLHQQSKCNASEVIWSTLSLLKYHETSISNN